MASFSESNFIKKLSSLNNTQQSIQTLSLWLIHHRKHSRAIVQVWFQQLQKAKPSKKLLFFYLANDVIQNSKKKGPEFMRDFATILGDAFQNAGRDSDEKSKQSMMRLLSIWQERGIYPGDTIRQYKNALANQKSSTATNSSSEPPVKRKRMEYQSVSLRDEIEQEPPGLCPEIEVLASVLADLEHSASSDAAVRERIAALPPEVSDASNLDKLQDRLEAEALLDKVEAACSTLAEYNSRLGMELEDRHRAARQLRDFIFVQKEQLKTSEVKLEEYHAKLASVTSISNELKSHIQKLPDLTLLPSISGGLAPLPSAGDLFSG